MTGHAMGSFVPLAVPPCEAEGSLLSWIKSWWGVESELLSPTDWYERGHDLTGEGWKNNDGIWFPKPSQDHTYGHHHQRPLCLLLRN